MQKDYPDHRDAELVLRAYELRRDPVMRESRRTIATEYWPRSLEEARAITRPDHPLNPAFRQVTSYWEMVYGMGRHGIVHPEYLVDASGGEGITIYAKIAPYLAEIRKASPRLLRYVEWAATETDAGRQILAGVQARVRQTLEQQR
jgi:hypothetical protein